jgi:hypothetical protein
MAKAPASDSIMTPEKMRPLLALSKHEPVQAAFGMTNDGEPLILLDKKAKPRRVLAMLRGDAAKAKLQLNSASVRFGRAEVDPDYDPGMVRFFVNKESPGVTRVRLLEVIKRVPFQKVELNVDPSLEAEEEEHDHEDTGSSVSGSDIPTPPPMPPSGQSQPDIATLRHELSVLVQNIGKIAANDADLRGRLTHLAIAPNEALKAGDLVAAHAGIVALGHAMSEAMHRTGGVAQGPHRSGEELLALFRDAKETVDAGINRLQAAMRDTQNEDLVRIADIGMYGMTNGEGVGLMKALMELRGAAPERREALAKATRDAAVAYKQAVFGHKLVDLVDNNPWDVPVGIKATLGPALDIIATAA